MQFLWFPAKTYFQTATKHTAKQMQAFPALGSKKRRAEKNVKIGGENKDRSWKYMYKNAPEGNITLEEFELYSFDRLTCNITRVQ